MLKIVSFSRQICTYNHKLFLSRLKRLKLILIFKRQICFYCFLNVQLMLGYVEVNSDLQTSDFFLLSERQIKVRLDSFNDCAFVEIETTDRFLANRCSIKYWLVAFLFSFLLITGIITIVISALFPTSPN